VVVTQCYTDLVDHLLSVGRIDDARRWATAGYEATIDNLGGIASGLQKRLRKMAEHTGDMKLVAAHRALEFFASETPARISRCKTRRRLPESGLR